MIAARADDLERFIAELGIDPPDATEAQATDDEDEWLTLSTVHSAKGLEWRAVWVVQLAQLAG